MKLINTVISEIEFGTKIIMVRHPRSWGEPKEHQDPMNCSDFEKLIEFTHQEGVFRCVNGSGGIYRAVYRQTFKKFTGAEPVKTLKE